VRAQWPPAKRRRRCAPLAAEHYRLDVVAHDIHDVEGAVTRFVLVAPAGFAATTADWR